MKRKSMIVPLLPVLLILLVAVACFNHWYFFADHMAPPRDRGPNQPLEKMDIGTHETMTRTLREWMIAGQQGGMCLNTRTGKYSMTNTMSCASCREKIPSPVMPPNAAGDVVVNIQDAYMCPLCHRHACPHPDTVPQPTSPKKTETPAHESRAAEPPSTETDTRQAELETPD